MNNWNEFLKAEGARMGEASQEVASFGHPDDELQAAASGTAMAPLDHLAVIECHGEDTREFLHNQLTSDINHLQDGHAQLAAWCSAKGRMLASFIVCRRGDRYRLILSMDLMSFIQKRLQMYVLRSKVSVTNLLESTVLLGLSGPDARQILTSQGFQLPEEKLQFTANERGDVVSLDEGRYLLAVDVESAPALWKQLSQMARPVGVPAWRWLDVRAALPWVTEATKEEFVPQMADFEKMGGVSFHKGCYPGQEIVARTQYLGKVKRHLYRLNSPLPLAAGDLLFSPEHPEQATGQIVSGAPTPGGGYAALAVVQALYAENLHLKSLDGIKVDGIAVNP